MDNEAVERAARAIRRAQLDNMSDEGQAARIVDGSWDGCIDLARAAIAAIGRDAEEGRQAYMEAAENEAKVCPWCQTWLAHECLSGNGCPTPDGKNGDTYHVTMPLAPPATDQSGEVDLTAVYMAGRADLLKENKRLREALTLARPIIESDWYQAREHADADWEGMSWTALQAIDAALSEGNGDG